MTSPVSLTRGFLLATHSFPVPGSTTWHERHHDVHELLWTASGTATLTAEGKVWTVPPSLCVWIPAGTVHSVSTTGPADVKATYVATTSPSTSPVADSTTGVWMTAPLRTMLAYNDESDMTFQARLRLQTVILDLLEPVPHHSFDIPLPRSDDLLAVARAVLRNPADRRRTDQWAHEHCLHPRALSRRFAAETGHTFTQWRILARMHLAVQRLIGGGTVVSVSRRLGYRSPSTFIDHFRSFTGQSPTQYLRSVQKP